MANNTSGPRSIGRSFDVDRECIGALQHFDHCVRVGARAMDVLFVPTSLVRTVMRREDEHLRAQELMSRMFEQRYSPSSKARWVAPIAYVAAGIGETARLTGYGALVYEMFKNLVS